MAEELQFTSTPQGLDPGASGYCTVQRTPGVVRSLQFELEALSAYRPQAPAAAADEDHLNPANYAHRILNDGRRRWHVVSRVGYAGMDYTGRNNQFAHHVLLAPDELPPGGPAWLASREGFLERAWSGQTQLVPRARTLPRDDGRGNAGPCQYWNSATGDAGWAGALIERYLEDPQQPCWLLYRSGQSVLWYIREALALLPPAERWNVTFCTYYNAGGKSDCLWRGVLEGSPEAAQAMRSADSGRLFDLRQPLGPCPVDTDWVTFAREGRAPASLQASATPATATAPARKQGATVPPPARGGTAVVPRRRDARDGGPQIDYRDFIGSDEPGRRGERQPHPVDGVAEDGNEFRSSAPPPTPVPPPPPPPRSMRVGTGTVVGAVAVLSVVVLASAAIVAKALKPAQEKEPQVGILDPLTDPGQRQPDRPVEQKPPSREKDPRNQTPEGDSTKSRRHPDKNHPEKNHPEKKEEKPTPTDGRREKPTEPDKVAKAPAPREEPPPKTETPAKPEKSPADPTPESKPEADRGPAKSNAAKEYEYRYLTSDDGQTEIQTTIDPVEFWQPQAVEATRMSLAKSSGQDGWDIHQQARRIASLREDSERETWKLVFEDDTPAVVRESLALCGILFGNDVLCLRRTPESRVAVRVEPGLWQLPDAPPAPAADDVKVGHLVLENGDGKQYEFQDHSKPDKRFLTLKLPEKGGPGKTHYELVRREKGWVLELRPSEAQKPLLENVRLVSCTLECRLKGSRANAKGSAGSTDRPMRLGLWKEPEPPDD